VLVTDLGSCGCCIPIVPDTMFEITDAVYVGKGGDATFLMASGHDATFLALQSGTGYRLRICCVRSEGLKADGLMALYAHPHTRDR